MKVNEGIWDRIIRAVIGVILAVLVFNHVGGTVGEWVLGIIAAVALLTAITGMCGLYMLIGVNTCRVPAKTRK